MPARGLVRLRQLTAPGAANQCAKWRVGEMPAEPAGADDLFVPVRGCLVKVTAVRARISTLRVVGGGRPRRDVGA